MREKIAPIKIFFILPVIIFALTVEAYAQEVAPDFTLTDIDGNEFSLSDYRGKVVLLDFMGIHCAGCVEEIPHLRAVHEKFGEDVVIISISTDPADTVERLKSFREEHGIGWTIARDTEGIYYHKYGVWVIPTLVLIDWEGYIRERYVGVTDESTISEKIIEIPEFPAVIVPLLFVILLSVAVVSGKVIRSTR